MAVPDGPTDEVPAPDPLGALHAEGVDGIASGVFVCSTCGRTDLPEAGGWDPPICLECDAEIKFAAIEEVEITEDW
jgi:hypothetical protein